MKNGLSLLPARGYLSVEQTSVRYRELSDDDRSPRSTSELHVRRMDPGEEELTAGSSAPLTADR